MADVITVSAPELSLYKGNPVLTLNPAGRVNMGFGLAKGMIIVENLAPLLVFLTSHGKEIGAGETLRAHAAEFLKMAGYPAK